MASRFFAYRFRELHPFEVQIMLMNACDLRCVYCRCPHVETNMLTTDQWLAVIRRLGALGTIRLKFQGGEPTLRPDFRELCEEAKAAGMNTAVVSHGLVIASRPELLDYLDEVVISLDSHTPEVNDRLRGIGTYHGAVQAIDTALQRGKRTLVNMVLTSENFADLEAMLEFCEARGVLMNAQPVVYTGRYFGAETQDLALKSDQIREVHLQLVEWKRQGRGLMYSAWTYQKAANWPDHNVITVPSTGVSSCVAGRDYIHIEANGDVLPCMIHGANFSPKNVLEDGLEEAFRHVRRHNCGDCWRVYYNERKAVFGLRPGALLDVLRRG
jgi:MoaA/NifB/PqqE/SkfB family radical SAM enzyme